MKVLVAGGAGYIGSVLVPMLIDQGHEVVVLDRLFFGDPFFGRNPDGCYAKTVGVRLEILQKDTREATIADFYGVDHVIDLAGLSNDPACDLAPDFTKSVNFEGAIHLAGCAHRAGVRRYTYSSSCAVYGLHDIATRPDEWAELHPLSEYARSKMYVEFALQRMWKAHGLLSILRLSTVYGLSPRMRFDLAPNIMALRVHRGDPIELWSAPDTWRPFVHVRDVAAIFAANVAPVFSIAGVCNVGSDAGTMTISALAKRIAALGTDIRIEHKQVGADARSYAPQFGSLVQRLTLAGQYPLLPATRIEDGVGEILAALRSGDLEEHELHHTVKRYQRLLEAGALCQRGVL